MTIFVVVKNSKNKFCKFTRIDNREELLVDGLEFFKFQLSTRTITDEILVPFPKLFSTN